MNYFFFFLKGGFLVTQFKVFVKSKTPCVVYKLSSYLFLIRLHEGDSRTVFSTFDLVAVLHQKYFLVASYYNIEKNHSPLASSSANFV